MVVYHNVNFDTDVDWNSPSPALCCMLLFSDKHRMFFISYLKDLLSY